MTGLPRAQSPSALALDIACGQGRHSLALKSAGYAVVAMDVSRRALEHLRAASPAARGAGLLAVQADIDAWPFADDCFDLAVQCDFLDRRLYPRLRACLKPGGFLLIDTFLDRGFRNADGPSRTEFLLQPGELAAEFDDFEILRHEESGGETARALLLARKPS